MALTDGDVAALARQAVDQLDPNIEIDIEPEDPVDPYRWGHQAWVIWPRIDGKRSFGIRLTSDATPADASAHLIATINENVDASRRICPDPPP